MNDQFEFIPVDRVGYVDLGPARSGYEGMQGIILPESPDAVIVRSPELDQWSLFNPSTFEERMKLWEEISEDERTEEKFRDLFEMFEQSRPRVVSPGQKIGAPTVVIRKSGKLDGVWVERSSPAESTGSNSGSEWLAPDTSPAAAEDDPVRRTPHMQLDETAVAQPGTEFEVSIFADDQPPDDDEDSEPIEISDTADQFDLAVWLTCSSGLQVIGESTKNLVILRNEASSTRATFRVKIEEGAPLESLGRLNAVFSFNGRPCGKVSRAFMIGSALGSPAPVAKAEPSPTNEILTVVVTLPDDVTLDDKIGEVEVKVRTPQTGASRNTPGGIRIQHPPSRPPDLTIVVTHSDDGGSDFDVRVSTPLIPEYSSGISGKWRLQYDTAAYVNAIFARFSGLRTTADLKADRLMRLDALMGAGRMFYRSSPPHFREVFQRLVDNGHPLETIYVVSQEPHIPWELMLPDFIRKDAPPWKPLGAEFIVGRWIDEKVCSPPVSAVGRAASVLCPNYDYIGSSQKVLAHAKPEADYVVEGFGGSHLTPANYPGFRNVIGNVETPLFHFVGHGGIDSKTLDEVLFLEDGQEVSAIGASGMPGLMTFMKKVRPMVFLNACQVGRPLATLIGAGGFPSTFADAGASAIVAPLWSVRDQTAHIVAREFYQAILDDWKTGNAPRPLARILRDIRRRAYDDDDGGEDSFAAYCFYGDPSFTLTAPPPRTDSLG